MWNLGHDFRIKIQKRGRIKPQGSKLTEEWEVVGAEAEDKEGQNSAEDRSNQMIIV